MIPRILAILENSYREAVRARILHGLFGLAIATMIYCLVVGQFALRSSMRVVSDLGAASLSLYSIIVAIVLGATSLYRELELKTLFPILARPVRRSEYLVGKYLGTVSVLLVFIAANAGVLLLCLGALSTASLTLVAGGFVGGAVVAVVVALRSPRMRSFVPIPWAAGMAVFGWFVSAGAPDERSVVVASSILASLEVCIVAAFATLFSSFSSPFLSAVFTFGLFIVGREADTLARLPERQFGAVIHEAAVWLSRVVPNLMVYVPPRMVLTGEAPDVRLAPYLLLAGAQALAWSAGLLAVAALVFRRRDFL